MIFTALLKRQMTEKLSHQENFDAFRLLNSPQIVDMNAVGPINHLHSFAHLHGFVLDVTGSALRVVCSNWYNCIEKWALKNLYMRNLAEVLISRHGTALH